MIRHKYAIQKPHSTEGWVFIATNPDTNERRLTLFLDKADWHDTLDDARNFVKGVPGARIVRRSVSDVEVVEVIE